MRKIFLLALIVITIDGMAQRMETFYVAAKSGLSLREKQDINSKVLVKIPYGTKISVAYETPYYDETANISSEGMEGQWDKTSFSGKTGYVVNSYLFPWPPPKATVKTLKQYFPQISAIAGAPVIVKSGSIESLESGGSNLKKQVFKNGAEYHEESFYESNNDAYFLPGFTLQQGFVLVRLIPEFKDVFWADESFPAAGRTFTKNGHEYKLTVDSEKTGDYSWINRISLEYEDGAVYNFQMFILGGQLVISFGGGV